MDSPEPPDGCPCLALDPLAENLECALDTLVLSCGPPNCLSNPRVRRLPVVSWIPASRPSPNLGSAPSGPRLDSGLNAFSWITIDFGIHTPLAPPVFLFRRLWPFGPLGLRMLAAILAGGAVDLTPDVGSGTRKVLPGGISHSRPLPTIAKASPIAPGRRLPRVGPARACEWGASWYWLGKVTAWERRVGPPAESLPSRSAPGGPWVG
jgi:hypothetical protein